MPIASSSVPRWFDEGSSRRPRLGSATGPRFCAGAGRAGLGAGGIVPPVATGSGADAAGSSTSGSAGLMI